MGRIGNDRQRDRTSGRFMAKPKERPPEFEATFVRIGRIACEEHFDVGRLTINAWLDECGKAELIELRREFVKRKEAERHERRGINRRDVKRILDHAYPVSKRYVNPAVAQRAAHHLRIVRHGGWIVSPMGGGLWRLGLRVVTAAELVELAKKAGFER